MRRSAWLVTVGLVVCLAGAGCSGTSTSTAPGQSTHGVKDAESAAAVPEGYTAIPVSGANEKAAVAAVPSALKAGLEMRVGQPEPDIAGIDPTFTAYLVSAVSGNTLVLFEVHADGVAHSLYNPTKPADSTTIMKQDASLNSGAILAEPASDAEKAAAAAVKAVLSTALPGEEFDIKILGYRFNYLKAAESVLQLEVNPDGGVASIS
ncbi:MAG: hypothetical protein CVT66_01470 [Actinobacteria bacterium HGW-Actinobacteria-6]|nr:MAG: hypothetical protein CVT66_01470 [Actinobacteria bacterium HGW-Actinobacteria-6]